MKKLILLSLIAIQGLVFAQKQEKANVSFEDVRLPLQPLEGLESYFFTVTTPYPENNNHLIERAKEKHTQDSLRFPQIIEEAEAKYQEALTEFDKDVVRARENYKLEQESFQKLSKLERLAMDDSQKPRLRMPSKPVYREPQPPRYYPPNLSRSIVFNPKILAKSYLFVSGVSEGTSNALVGHVEFQDFENQELKTLTKDQRYKKSDGTYGTRKVNYFVLDYKRPTYLKLEYNGLILYDELFEPTKNFTSQSFDRRPNVFQIEKQSITKILEDINAFINSNYGFSIISTQLDILYPKNKKGDYDLLEEAKDLCIDGLRSFESGGANEKIHEAIALWKQELALSDLEDKKARINKKVTESILFNLMHIGLVVDDIELSEEAFYKLKDMKLSYAKKKLVSAFESKIKDEKKRVEANK